MTCWGVYLSELTVDSLSVRGVQPHSKTVLITIPSFHRQKPSAGALTPEELLKRLHESRNLEEAVRSPGVETKVRTYAKDVADIYNAWASASRQVLFGSDSVEPVSGVLIETSSKANTSGDSREHAATINALVALLAALPLRSNPHQGYAVDSLMLADNKELDGKLGKPGELSALFDYERRYDHSNSWFHDHSTNRAHLVEGLVGSEAVDFYTYALEVIQKGNDFPSMQPPFYHALEIGSDQLNNLTRASNTVEAARKVGLNVRAAGEDDRHRHMFNVIIPELILLGLNTHPGRFFLSDSTLGNDQDRIRAKMALLYENIQKSNGPKIAKSIAHKAGQILSSVPHGEVLLPIVVGQDISEHLAGLLKLGKNCLPQAPIVEIAKAKVIH